MSMTKAEKAEMDALRTARDLARALRWPEYSEPQAMTEAEVRADRSFKMNPRYGADQYACAGWTANLSSYSWSKPEVRQLFSSGSSNTTDPAGQNWSQGMGQLYRSKIDALRRLRLELTQEYAGRLAAVDAMIANETP